MVKKTTTPAKADPFAELGIGLAADHKAAKAKEAANPEPAEVADTVAAGAINGAGAAVEAGGDARDVAAAAIGGAAAATAEVTDTAPAAPGDDRETVFERRLDRLTKAVEVADFDSGTAFGDLRDVILELYKQRPKAWSELVPSERNDLTRHVEGLVKGIVRKIVYVIAAEESLTVEGVFLGDFAVKGEAISAKLKIEHVDSDTLLDIYRMAGHRVVIVSADDKRFQSARRKLDAGDDQIAMTFADDKPKAETPPADPPADDSDLAGEDPKPNDAEVDDEPFEERDPALFLVFDKSSGEYLIDEDGGENGWTDTIVDAGKWPLGTATDLTRAFGSDDGLVVTVPVEDIPAEVVDPTDEERTHDETSAVND